MTTELVEIEELLSLRNRLVAELPQTCTGRLDLSVFLELSEFTHRLGCLDRPRQVDLTW
jgi:hypothetical protein